MVKWMGMDFVLAYPQHRYLANETQKLESSWTHSVLKYECRPRRICCWRDGRTQITPYFVDKFPLSLFGAPCDPIAAGYVSRRKYGNLGTDVALNTQLLEYRDFLGRSGGYSIGVCVNRPADVRGGGTDLSAPLWEAGSSTEGFEAQNTKIFISDGRTKEIEPCFAARKV